MEKEPEGQIIKLQTPATVREELTGEVEIPTTRVLLGVSPEPVLVGFMLERMTDEEWEETFDILGNDFVGPKVIK